ncbi:MAG TPA: insulinase family protein, partial [Thermoanaerobaculia bacterium]|nr:insulinase family protein [Thermoanaerobaculia bacterium]
MSARALALALALVMPPAASAPPDRTGPPAPGPVRPLRFPPVARFSLRNGLEVRLVPAHAVPVVTALLVVKTGGASDPAGQEGIAATTASMLDEGAGGRDALAVEDELGFLGAS